MGLHPPSNAASPATTVDARGERSVSLCMHARTTRMCGRCVGCAAVPAPVYMGVGCASPPRTHGRIGVVRPGPGQNPNAPLSLSLIRRGSRPPSSVVSRESRGEAYVCVDGDGRPEEARRALLPLSCLPPFSLLFGRMAKGPPPFPPPAAFRGRRRGLFLRAARVVDPREPARRRRRLRACLPGLCGGAGTGPAAEGAPPTRTLQRDLFCPPCPVHKGYIPRTCKYQRGSYPGWLLRTFLPTLVRGPSDGVSARVAPTPSTNAYRGRSLQKATEAGCAPPPAPPDPATAARSTPSGTSSVADEATARDPASAPAN